MRTLPKAHSSMLSRRFTDSYTSLSSREDNCQIAYELNDELMEFVVIARLGSEQVS